MFTKTRVKFFSCHPAGIAVNKLEALAECLPLSERFIRHNGYRIASLAQISRLKQSRTRDWIDLLNLAEQIPNLPDKSYTICLIASAMPSRERQKANDAFENSLNLSCQIPSVLDKVHSLMSVADEAKTIRPDIAKSALSKAMQATMSSDELSIYSAQRKIIDLAYRLDENLATSFATLVDDDPAKQMTERNINRRLDFLKLKKTLADPKQQEYENKTKRSEHDQLAQIAWKLLGSVNSGSAAFGLNNLRNFLSMASEISFGKAYPIMAFVLEFSVRRYGNNDQALTILRPLFEATLLGAELTRALVARSSRQLEKAKIFSGVKESDSILIHAGEREKALHFLQNWFENSVNKYLKICDPYFGPEELEVIQLLQAINPDCEVFVLTSKEHHDKKDKPWSETYRKYWKFKLSPDQPPPFTEIVIVGTPTTGKLPIHDRWWITKGGYGLRMGTSFGSLGISRDSEISFLSQEDTQNREAELDEYFNNIKRKHNGERLIFERFTLY